MSDKMTIISQDGKAKYELAPDNTIIDLRDTCTCPEGQPEQRDGERRVCLVCGNTIK